MVGNNEYHGLKALFAVKSTTFRDLLYSGNNVNRITLADISASAFEFVRDWCYELSPQLSFDNVVDVLHAAKQYNLGSIQSECSLFLSNISDADDFLNVLIKFGQQSTLSEELNIILENSVNLLQSGNELINNLKFGDLPICLISRLIENDNLYVDEEELFSVLKSHTELLSLKPLFRFGLMSSGFLFEVVKQSNILTGSELVSIYEYKLGLRNDCGFRCDQRNVIKKKQTANKKRQPSRKKKTGNKRNTKKTIRKTAPAMAPTRRSSRLKK